MANLEKYAKRLFEDNEKNIVDKAILGGLSAGETLYSFGLNMLLSFYEAGHVNQYKLDAFTISVGNITAGGTGKTPFVQYMTKKLQAKGKKVGILSRGYRGAYEKEGAIVSDGKKVLLNPEQAGDEPYLLAKTLPGAVISVGKDRIASGKRLQKLFRPNVVLLDDGFQHWPLRRDLDIVLIDAADPFSNGHVIPRGLLREPVENIERADIYVITKADAVSSSELEKIKNILRHYRNAVPIAVTAHRPDKVKSFLSWRDGLDEAEKMPSSVVTLCALGSPESFEATVKQAGLRVVGRLRLPDHHAYTRDDVMKAILKVKEEHADALVVSEKDAVKIAALDMPEIKNLYVMTMKIDFLEGEKEMWDYIYDEWEASK